MNLASCRIFLDDLKPAREELEAIIRELDAAKTRDIIAARARYHLVRALLAMEEKPAAINALRESIAIYDALPAENYPTAQRAESEALLKKCTDE